MAGYSYIMEQWRDQGIVLSARAHGENGAVVALLTESNGRHAGYVHGAHSKAKRAMIEPGAGVTAQWSSRVEGQLGTYSLEPENGLPPGIMQDGLRLGALLSACALCDAALPEREGHPGLYYGLKALIDMLGDSSPPYPPASGGDAHSAGGEKMWAASYIYWELALLKELGFGLDLTKCAMNGDAMTLTHVSPKSGRAVSAAAAAPYKEKLLLLPEFLKPLPPFIPPAGGGEDADEGSGRGGEDDIFTGLKLTAYFLEHWVFAHHTKGMPEARQRFQERFEKSLLNH